MKNKQDSPVVSLKILSWSLWIPHIVSLVALYYLLPVWVGVVCSVLCVLAEKRLGFYIDIFSFVLTLVFASGAGDKSVPVVLPILQGVGLLLPLIALGYFYFSQIGAAQESIESDEESADDQDAQLLPLPRKVLSDEPLGDWGEYIAQEQDAARDLLPNFDFISWTKRSSILAMLRSAKGVDKKTKRFAAQLIAANHGLNIHFGDCKVGKGSCLVHAGGLRTLLVDRQSASKELISVMFAGTEMDEEDRAALNEALKYPGTD